MRKKKNRGKKNRLPIHRVARATNASGQSTPESKRALLGREDAYARRHFFLPGSPGEKQTER